MKRHLFTAVLGSALCLTTPGAMAADTIVTGPVDQAGFQALIDAASPGDTIVCLGGVYDFGAPGPVYLDKGLKIQAADPGDPPIFRGDGTINTPYPDGNNGFVQADGSFIDGLTIQGLHFEDLDRPLAFTSSHRRDLPGCPPIPGAGARKLRILDNTVRNSRRLFQVFDGPAEDIVIRGNDLDLIGGDLGITVTGGAGFCSFDFSYYESVRPSNGMIQGNYIRGDLYVGIWVDGAERITVKENLIEGGFAGMLFADSTAYWLSEDDGPIRLGMVKENIIDGALFGIFAEGTTTITGAQIKDNQISGGEIGVVLDFGANGFEVKANDFSAIGLAEVYLGLDEENLIPNGCGFGIDSDLYACAPDAHQNVVKVYEGDRVMDFGVGNVVKIVD